MYSASFLVLALAFFGASAQTLCTSGSNALFSGINTGFLPSGLSSGLSSGLVVAGGLSNGISTGVSTPILENPTITLPGLITPSAVQDTCNCVQTVVKPTMRQEIYNIPSVQRFVQTSSTPIVESVPYVTGGAVDIPTTVQGAPSLSFGTGLSLGSGFSSGSFINSAPALISSPALSSPAFISAPGVSAQTIALPSLSTGAFGGCNSISGSQIL